MSAPRSRRSKAWARKVVLIAGGDGKGQDFSPLKPSPGPPRPRRGADRPRRAEDRRGHRRLRRAGRRTPPTWTRPCATRRGPRRPATPCCSRRPAPASTCSATTSIAPRCSSRRCSGLAQAMSAVIHRQPPPDAGAGRAGRARSAAAVAGAGPADVRPGDGVFGLDRHRRGQPLHRQPGQLFPGAPRRLPRHRPGRRRGGVPGAAAPLAAGARPGCSWSAWRCWCSC